MRQRLRNLLSPQPPTEDEGRPHARPLFRLLAGLFALAFLLIPWSVLRSWWQGEAMPDMSALGDWAQFASLCLMALMFGAVALTGRVPGWTWALFKRWS